MTPTKENIWQFKQNKPSYIVQDLKELYPNIDENEVYKILLQRGVFKWLHVRRELIKLKILWKDDIRKLNCKKTEQQKGFLKALERCTKDVRLLCHSDRWVSPDFDSNAQKFLKRMEE